MCTSHDIVQVAIVTEEFTPLCYDLPYVNNNCHNLQATAIDYKKLCMPGLTQLPEFVVINGDKAATVCREGPA